VPPPQKLWKEVWPQAGLDCRDSKKMAARWSARGFPV
jgi:hypothetical protein